MTLEHGTHEKYAIIFLLGGTLMSQAHTAPMIWGDGKHDDTAGFEALVCKRWFRYRPGAVIESTMENGENHFAFPAVYFLPNGIPVPKGGNSPIINLSVDVPTYEIDCEAGPKTS